MGVRLGDDSIATPSHSSGVITLPPSLLTLGGQQYYTGTLLRTIADDVTMAENTLYFVYCQIISGNAALRISASPPSVYKAGNRTAKLVAAFYSDGMTPVEFGSFVTIDGVPTTLTAVPFKVSQSFSGSNGSSTIDPTTIMLYRKHGGTVFVQMRLRVLKGSASGNFTITGLPFSVETGGKGELHCGNANAFITLPTSSAIVFAQAQAPNTMVFTAVSTADLAINPITAAHMSSSTMLLSCELTYATAFDGKPLVNL